MPRVARSTRGTAKKTPYATRHTAPLCDVDTPNDGKARQRSSNKGTGKRKLLLARFCSCLPLFRHPG